MGLVGIDYSVHSTIDLPEKKVTNYTVTTEVSTML